MRLRPVSDAEFERRVKKLQLELSARGMDVFVGYSSESESSTSRYLAGFWPFFDFACVVVPKEGDAVLVTGGPESYEFAKRFSSVRKLAVNPLLVETSPPEWIPEVTNQSFDTILKEACGYLPNVVGVANWNIFPRLVFEDLKKGAPRAEFVPADDLLLKVQAIKSAEEIPYIVEAYRITEEAMKAAFSAAKPGVREWELEAVARSTMATLGAEGTSYPIWVCSGANTVMSLCRSTDRAIQKDELIQFTFGAKYMGYCGNMCRAFSIGSMPRQARRLADAALESVRYALGAIAPGKKSSELFSGYHEILSKYGLEKASLYGPAHGTGFSEVEGLWLSKSSDFTIEPGMLFNIDIWLCDGQYGLRFEDGILVTQQGIRELTSYRREIIEL